MASISEKISECSGKRPSFFFEKINLPSTFTSKTPPLPWISSGFSPYFDFSSAARPAAFGS